MLQVLEALYKMLANTTSFPEGEETPQKRLDALFNLMDTNNDGVIDLQEYKEGAKKDPVIIQSLFLYDGLV